MNRPVKSHIFGGKRWRVDSPAGLPKGQLGGCENWNLGADLRRIQIPMDGDTLPELDTIIHESAHASCPWMDEDAVEQLAADIARLLWRLDWRKGE